MRSLGVGLPILAALAVLQSTVLAQFTLLDGRADLILVVVLCWAMAGRGQDAMVWALIGGLSRLERHLDDFDAEVGSLSRIDQAVAFLALLELRKAGEIALEQAAPFAPIRVSRPDVERGAEWIARSA